MCSLIQSTPCLICRRTVCTMSLSLCTVWAYPHLPSSGISLPTHTPATSGRSKLAALLHCLSHCCFLIYVSLSAALSLCVCVSAALTAAGVAGSGAGGKRESCQGGCRAGGWESGGSVAAEAMAGRRAALRQKEGLDASTSSVAGCEEHQWWSEALVRCDSGKLNTAVRCRSHEVRQR